MTRKEPKIDKGKLSYGGKRRLTTLYIRPDDTGDLLWLKVKSIKLGIPMKDIVTIILKDVRANEKHLDKLIQDVYG